MNIEKIIYNTTREVLNLEDKLSIATIFLFCEKLGSKKLAELLYCDCLETFIDNLQEEYKNYDVDFTIRLDNRNVSNAFFKTLEKVKETEDSNGFLKALYNKDVFALAIYDICNYNFNTEDFFKFNKKIKELQLTLF